MPSAPSSKLIHPKLTDATVFPVALDKRPASKASWPGGLPVPANATGYAIDCGASGLIVVDIDRNHQAEGEEPVDGVEEWTKLLEAKGVTAPETFTVRSPADGLHLYFRAPAGVTIGNSSNKLARSVDVRATGGYIVGPGSKAYAKEMERNADGTPVFDKEGHAKFSFNKERINEYVVERDLPIADLPTWIAMELAAPKKEERVRSEYTFTGTPGVLLDWQQDALREACTRLASAAPGTRDATIMEEAKKIGLKLGPEHAMVALPQLQQAVMSWGVDDQPELKVERHFNWGAERHDPGYLKDRAPLSSASQTTGSGVVVETDDAPLRPLSVDYFTTVEAARRFADAYRGRICFVGDVDSPYWMTYSEGTGVWSAVNRAEVKKHATAFVCDEFADAEGRRDRARALLAGADVTDENDPETKKLLGLVKRIEEETKQALRNKDVRTVSTIVEGAQGSLLLTAEQFDRTKHVKAARNGIIDLRNGELLPFSPELLATQHVDINYVKGARSWKWDLILSSAPEDCHDWLQAWFGQALTGDAGKLFLIMLGDAHTGKSKFAGTMMATSGGTGKQGYGFTPAKSSFLGTSGKDTDFYAINFLKGRFGMMEEFPEDRINGPATKAFFDTEYIEAHRKGKADGEPVENQANVCALANNPPQISGSDDGLKRRMAPLEFEGKYTKNPTPGTNERQMNPAVDGWISNRDPELMEAALAWRVEGGKRYYADKTIADHEHLPARVEKKRDAWFGDNDPIREWVESHLVFDENSFVLTEDLHTAFEEYTAIEKFGTTGFLKRLRASLHATFGEQVEDRRDTSWSKLVQSLYVSQRENWKLTQKDSDGRMRYSVEDLAKVPKTHSRARYIPGIRFRGDSDAALEADVDTTPAQEVTAFAGEDDFDFDVVSDDTINF